MTDMNALPRGIAEAVRGLPHAENTIGRSGAEILMFDRAVLKISPFCAEAEREITMLRWLSGRLAVPKLLRLAEDGGKYYILMTRLSGEMACSAGNLSSPKKTVAALADGLSRLWSVNIAGCPAREGLDEKLAVAKLRVERGLVNADELDASTLGEGGFASLEELYGFLAANRPSEDTVLSHGDYCLPNVFISGEKAVGFLDLGRCGVSDRWQDIALCVRSLDYNFRRSGEAERRRYRSLFFEALGVETDEDKIRYFLLLDELF